MASIRRSALVEGLIAGVIVGAAEWFALRRFVSWLWIPATGVGIAVGLTAGAALVDYGIGRGDLALMGAVTGLGVGVFQALVLICKQDTASPMRPCGRLRTPCLGPRLVHK